MTMNELPGLYPTRKLLHLSPWQYPKTPKSTLWKVASGMERMIGVERVESRSRMKAARSRTVRGVAGRSNMVEEEEEERRRKERKKEGKKKRKDRKKEREKRGELSTGTGHFPCQLSLICISVYIYIYLYTSPSISKTRRQWKSGGRRRSGMREVEEEGGRRRRGRRRRQERRRGRRLQRTNWRQSDDWTELTMIESSDVEIEMSLRTARSGSRLRGSGNHVNISHVKEAQQEGTDQAKRG
jgi:hypothetical protein